MSESAPVVRDHFVYRVFDAEGQLLYIGCTMRPSKRWAEHKIERPGMVAAAARFRVQGPYPRPVARALEKQAIRTEEPLLGWTPAKHRENCGRRRWTDRRARELHGSGVEVWDAIRQACDESDDVLPDPDAHESEYRFTATRQPRRSA